MKENFMEAFRHVQDESDDTENIPPAHSANAMNHSFPKLLSLLKLLQVQVATLTAEN